MCNLMHCPTLRAMFLAWMEPSDSTTGHLPWVILEVFPSAMQNLSRQMSDVDILHCYFMYIKIKAFETITLLTYTHNALQCS